MKKIVSFVLVVLTITTAVLLTGCGDSSPQKPGGGGKLQPYDKGTGQYN